MRRENGIEFTLEQMEGEWIPGRVLGLVNRFAESRKLFVFIWLF